LLWLIVRCRLRHHAHAAGPNVLVTPLPKLTAAVDALVRYPDPAYPVPDDQLVAVAIKDLPGLQRPLPAIPSRCGMTPRTS